MADVKPQMITANRLTDGAVVYLASGDQWTEDFKLGALWRDQETADQALAGTKVAVDARIVVAPYLIDIRETEQGLTPATTKERIRADHGPSIEVDSGTWTKRIKD